MDMMSCNVMDKRRSADSNRINQSENRVKKKPIYETNLEEKKHQSAIGSSAREKFESFTTF